MNGLRIYINAEAPETSPGELVFYTRRANGPYYRWSYEVKQAKWQSARLPTSYSTKDFSIAAWKNTPAALKDRLNEHYLE
ncbi:MAG TPA: hypothetical protein VMM84_02410 [Pyrinomonadaceae bacterium]|nr:hypothetical protein [Pyrinomonadaceae bacterium]